MRLLCLQDAVQARNAALVRLCLVALGKIPFAEAHIVCMVTLQMNQEGDGSQPRKWSKANGSSQTISEYIERLKLTRLSPEVQNAAAALLDKWQHVCANTDTVILTGKQVVKKGAKGMLQRPTAPTVFPNDRRMKATEPVALPLTSKDALAFKSSVAGTAKGTVRT
jgi:hypothetical protein